MDQYKSPGDASALNFMMPRADFRPEMFDSLVTQKGYRVMWQQGMFCSCYDMKSGQPDYKCPVCEGKGYRYIDDKIIRVIITSINGHREQERIGLHDVGSAYLTPSSSDNVGFRDRFTFMDFTTKYSEVITRGTDDIMDGLRYRCVQIHAIRTLDSAYIEGTDFVIETNEDRSHIRWLSPSISEGQKYSVLYSMNPVYIAINPVHELRGTYTMFKGGGKERFVKLPKQFQIKREDMLENGVGALYGQATSY